MQRFGELFRVYLLIVAAPLLIVGAGLGCSLLAMAVVASIEQGSGRPTPFDLEIPAVGHARFFLVALGAQMLFSGGIVANGALASIRFGRRQLELAPPLARVAGAQMIGVGACILGFYVFRHLIFLGGAGGPF